MGFGERLKELRRKRGISQEALAKAVFVSRSAVAKWENDLGIPSDDNLQALCDYFGVEEGWLLDRRDLKRQVRLGAQQAVGIAVALAGLATVLIYVLLGFTLTFHQTYSISMYYPSVSFFRFIVTYGTGAGVWSDAKTTAAFALLCVSAAVWTVHAGYAVLSLALPVFRKNLRLRFWLNVALTALSAVMFLTLFLVTLEAAASVYGLWGSRYMIP